MSSNSELPSFKENWELSALTDYNSKQTFTYQTMSEEIEKMHILFNELNIKKNDKIALVGRNTPTWAITFLSVVTYGAVIVPILQDFHPNDIHHIVNHSDSVLLFVGDNIWDNIDEDHLENVKGIFSLKDKHYSVLNSFAGEEVHHAQQRANRRFSEKFKDGFKKEDVNYAETSNEDLVLINYTSGTTGFSKGVMLTGNNLAGNTVFGIKQKLHYRGTRCQIGRASCRERVCQYV